jgi:diguanylate cyclase (GGDEF)-like protein
MSLWALASGYHAAKAQAQAQGAMALALIEQGPADTFTAPTRAAQPAPDKTGDKTTNKAAAGADATATAKSGEGKKAGRRKATRAPSEAPLAATSPPASATDSAAATSMSTSDTAYPADSPLVRAVGQSLSAQPGILAIAYCHGSHCKAVHASANTADTADTAAWRGACTTPLGWPAACVSVASQRLQGDTVSVHYDLRPVGVSAATDLAGGLLLLGSVALAWRHARGARAVAHMASEPQLRQVAQKDALTGLLNRVAFESALKRHNEAESIGRMETDGCLMYFDLDRFKLINDTHGHIAGDLVLKTVAQRLRYTLGGSVLIGRLGGDEFAALLTDVSSRATIETICRVLIEQVSQPILIGDVKEWVGLSIGAYMLKRGQLNLGEMLHRADLAMYEAKRAGRGRLVFYDDSMDAAARCRAQVQADLKKAVEQRQFFMVYQPQFDAHDRVRGVEAMVRWRHPTRGLIPPEEFVPVAEQSGLSVPLGKIVIDMTCADLVALRAQRLALPYVSMDVSLRQLTDVAMVDDVQDALQRHGLSTDDIEFEVSESTAMVGQSGKETATLKKLSALAFRIAIDDFGSGNSSMGRLLDLKVDKLKIDAMFVRAIDQPNFNPALLELMIDLANRFGVKSVAEGVDTLAQVAWLRKAGCQMLQGSFFAKPMTRDQLVGWMQVQAGDKAYEGGVWAATQAREDAVV